MKKNHIIPLFITLFGCKTHFTSNHIKQGVYKGIDQYENKYQLSLEADSAFVLRIDHSCFECYWGQVYGRWHHSNGDNTILLKCATDSDVLNAISVGQISYMDRIVEIIGPNTLKVENVVLKRDNSFDSITN